VADDSDLSRGGADFIAETHETPLLAILALGCRSLPGAGTAATGALAAEPAGAVADSAGRQVLDFNGDWSSPRASRRGSSAQIDDSTWQTVRLPHDWAISGPFNPGRTAMPASSPGEGGVYRKTFCPRSDPGRPPRISGFRRRHGVSPGLRERPACRVGLRLHVVPRRRHAASSSVRQTWWRSASTFAGWHPLYRGRHLPAR
jgi:hypothetical protein